VRGAILCVALAFAFAMPGASAAVIDQAANGFTVENSQWVPTDPDTSWKAFVDEVGKWWPADHTWWGDASKLSISQKVGGCFCEMNGPRQGMGLNGALEWRFAEEKGGTRITLWYRAGGYTPDDPGEFVPVIDKVQGLQLGGLADYLRKQSAKQP
jgi:hypothetical protein